MLKMHDPRTQAGSWCVISDNLSVQLNYSKRISLLAGISEKYATLSFFPRSNAVNRVMNESHFHINSVLLYFFEYVKTICRLQKKKKKKNLHGHPLFTSRLPNSKCKKKNVIELVRII